MARFDELTGPGRRGLDAACAAPSGALLGLDYDGTLAPIVADPAAAIPFPGTTELLSRLASTLGTVAVITGRPAADVARLLGLTPDAGVLVLGQYGAETRDPETGRIRTHEPPPGVDAVRRTLPGLLAELEVADAFVEDKGLAIAVHVRRSADPAAVFGRIVGPLTALAERTGLRAEPGRLVVELRPPGIDKGGAIRSLVASRAARSIVYCGDDLGDLAAFAAVEALRATTPDSPDAATVVAGLLVCAGSTEVAELRSRADVVVDGPAGVHGLLTELVSEVEGRLAG